MRFLLPAAVVVVLDQLTKQFFWKLGRSYELIEGYFNITLVKNAGAAFGLFQGGRVFFILASVAAIAFIIYLGIRMSEAHRLRRVLLGMILGGAVGNLIDRALAGEVIDFLQIGVNGHYWPVFNVADIAVSVGAALLLVDLLRHGSRDPAGVTVAQPVADGDPPADS